MSPDLAVDALRPLPAGYRELYERVLAAAASDDRVRAMWLSGSLGRGVADAGSDLDVVLAVAPAAFDTFAASWRDWLASVTPTVLAKPLPRLPGSWYSVTPSCLRLDVVTEPAGSAQPDALAWRLLVLDKDGTAGQAVPAGEPTAAMPTGPDRHRLTDLADEFCRQLAIFPAAVVARQDWLLGVVGVQGIQLLLYQLFVEANQPQPPMGAKQWSARLTPSQRHVCAGLPSPAANPASVLEAMRAAAAAFRREAADVFAANEVTWPAAFDQAVQRYWQSALGWAE
jgi:hypothetical protein